MRYVLTSSILLGLFALVGTTLVAFTYERTAERIAENERQALLRHLHELVHPEIHDNDLYSDRIRVRDVQLLGTPEPVNVFRARQGDRPVALVMAPVAPDGYGGAIQLLVGVFANGRLAGVRVLSHHETPGLGDAIEADRSDWIYTFDGLALGDPPPDQWRVKKDGGAFDQFTGATITPRAVVNAVYKALLYFRTHQQSLFQTPAKPRARETSA